MVVGGGSETNQEGIRNRQFFKVSGTCKTLEKYSPHSAIVNVGEAPAMPENNFWQAGQNPVPKSFSVTGLLG